VGAGSVLDAKSGIVAASTKRGNYPILNWVIAFPCCYMASGEAFDHISAGIDQNLDGLGSSGFQPY
jgi:hypothetical protein